MLRPAFSETDQQALHYERYLIRIRACSSGCSFLWLKSQGLPHYQIAQLCAISANTLRSYLKLYHTGGCGSAETTQLSLPTEPVACASGHRSAGPHPPQTINEAVAMPQP